MKNKYFDVTVPLKSGMMHWPGDPEINIYKVASFENGDGVNISGMNLGLHTGTHMDAPFHFINGGKDIASVSPEILIGPARVIYIKHQEYIGIDELKEHKILPGERILFRTKNSDREWFNNEFSSDYVYLNKDGAEYLVSLKIKIAGIDYLSIAEFKKGSLVHRILLKSGIWIIEGLYLSNVPEGHCEIYALPLRIPGADGSPLRVILKF